MLVIGMVVPFPSLICPDRLLTVETNGAGGEGWCQETCGLEPNPPSGGSVIAPANRAYFYIFFKLTLFVPPPVKDLLRGKTPSSVVPPPAA